MTSRSVTPSARPAGAGPVTAGHVSTERVPCPSRAGRRAVHEHHVLALYTGGRARMEQRGLWDLRPGDALLVPAGEPHRLLEVSRAEYWGLSFLSSGYRGPGHSSLLEPFEHVRDGGSAVVRIPGERQGLLHTLFGELGRVSRAPAGADAASSAVRDSLLTLILSEVGEAARAQRPAAFVPGQSVVTRSLQFIEQNYLRRLTLSEIAAAVDRSPAHVTSALTRATGRSATRWVIDFRMAEARKLLLHSDLPVSAIAERVGYADTTHFVRLFRRAHQLTPGAWRAAQRP